MNKDVELDAGTICDRYPHHPEPKVATEECHFVLSIKYQYISQQYKCYPSTIMHLSSTANKVSVVTENRHKYAINMNESES